MRITRRTLQIALGLLWLLDGALQLQPYMFHSGFARDELAAAGAGQPGFVAHPVHWAAALVLTHPAIYNTGFAVIQLAIGAGLLWRRSTRLALFASLGWGLSVWFLGEGLGGLASGATLLTGAPGAALLYVVVAAVAFPVDGRGSVAPSRWALPAWSALWLAGVGLQLAAGNNSGDALGAMFADVRTDNTGWIARLDGHLAGLHLGAAAVAALVAVEALIALWAFVPGVAQKLSCGVGIALATATWVVVQGFGDLTTGRATDPNTGPLIVLLALAAYGSRRAWDVALAPSPRRTDAVLSVAA